MRSLSFGLLVCLWLLPGHCLAEVLGVVEPVFEDGQALSRKHASGRVLPVVRRQHAGDVYAAVQQEARAGFTARILALDAMARELAEPSRREPVWLYLSPEDGGFARHGFWLRDGDGERYVDAPYIDLVVDENSLADGSFEEIFAHEMGHVFLRRLLPSLPAGFSRTPHHAFSLTDYPTAFDEGFAIHFQLLARRLTANSRLQAIDHGFDTRPFLPYWLSHRDRGLRIQGVRSNLFVQAQRPMEAGMDPLAQEQLSTEFAAASLRNGQQMLSSEGVVATLFHRWIGPVPQQALEEAYRPWFRALARLDARAPGPDAALVPMLIQALHETDPEKGRAAITTFIDATYGLTEDASLRAGSEALAGAGAMGDLEAYVGHLAAARDALGKVREQALAEPGSLGAALGPAIWLMPSDEPSVINLNTAGRAGLMQLALGEGEADRLLSSRRRDGAFMNLEDAVRRAQLPASSREVLVRARQAMETVDAHPRR